MPSNSFDDIFDSCNKDSVTFLNGLTNDNLEVSPCMLYSENHSPSINIEDHSTLKLNNSSSGKEFEKTEHNVSKTKKCRSEMFTLRLTSRVG